MRKKMKAEEQTEDDNFVLSLSIVFAMMYLSVWILFS